MFNTKGGKRVSVMLDTFFNWSLKHLFSFFVQGSVFLPLFTSLLSGHQFLIQRGYSHEFRMQNTAEGLGRRGNLAVLVLLCYIPFSFIIGKR